MNTVKLRTLICGFSLTDDQWEFDENSDYILNAEIANWLHDSCIGRWYLSWDETLHQTRGPDGVIRQMGYGLPTQPKLCFTDNDDAMLFKLTWFDV